MVEQKSIRTWSWKDFGLPSLYTFLIGNSASMLHLRYDVSTADVLSPDQRFPFQKISIIAFE